MNDKKYNIIRKVIIIVILVLAVVLIGCKGLYEVFYVNGNTDENIERVVAKVIDKESSEINDFRVIESNEFGDEKLVVYKYGLNNYGFIELEKDKFGNYKHSYLEEQVGDIVTFFYRNRDLSEQHFIFCGDGYNTEVGKIEFAVNNEWFDIEILGKDTFIHKIDINQIMDRGNMFEFQYRYYDKEGELLANY